MRKVYSGLGCRDISANAEAIVSRVAAHLSADGYLCRTGGNLGAQRAFEKASAVSEVYLPWKNSNENKSHLYHISPECFEIASGHTPKWGKMTGGLKKVLAAEVHILLGKDLDKPSQFVLTWENKEDSDSLRYTRRLAASYGIQVYNIADYSAMEIMQALGGE
jgi:hypothetical protein